MSRRLLIVVAIAAALGTAGCAQSAIEPETSHSLRDRVHAVTVAAASEDWVTATAELEALTAEVDEAAAAGRIDDDRYRALTSTIELVAADLAAAQQAATPTPEPTAPEPTSPEPPGKGNGNGKGPKKP